MYDLNTNETESNEVKMTKKNVSDRYQKDEKELNENALFTYLI